VDISVEGSEIVDILDVALSVENALIEVRDTPAERNVEVEEV
jgi:hypothetical protein